MTPAQAIQKIKTTQRCTEAQARALGLYVTRGAYVDTYDDRLDRWYVDTLDGPVDRRSAGYYTKRQAYQEIVYGVIRGEITDVQHSPYT